jgi:hypothetical protein
MQSKSLARIRPTKGLAFDVPAWETTPDFYNRLFNVLIRNGFPQRIGGKRNAYDPPSGAPLHVFNAPMLGNNFWLYQTVNRIFSVVGGTHTDITPAGGPMPNSVAKPSQWSHAVLNGIPVFNNSLDSPCYWLGNTAFDAVTLTGWTAGTLAKIITQHRYHLFALNITVGGVNNGNYYLWSDKAAPGAIPGSWTPSASNEAGFDQVSDTPGVIVTARSLRDSLIIYKNNAAYSLDYIGGNDKFAKKLLWSRAGALSPRAVDDANGVHVVVTQGDIVLNDGYSQPVSISTGLVNNFLFGQLNSTTYEALQVLYDFVNQEVWILFPESGETYCTIALVYNMRSQAWGVVDLADVAYASLGIIDDTSPGTTWDTDAGTWDNDTTTWNEDGLTTAIEGMLQAQPLITKLVYFGTGDLVAMDSLVAKYSMTFGEPERVKLLKQVHLRGRNFGTFFVRVGYQMFPDDVLTWSAETSITDPGQPIPTFTQGRYISIEVRASDSAVWDLTGIDMEVEMKGYF